MGILYIVATPIGNLKDITLRALEVLREADLIVCEDTRVTLKLLNHYGISKPLVSYFQHSKLSKLEYIIDRLRGDKKVALVTDAGTPGISDPGRKLIEELTRSSCHSPAVLRGNPELSASRFRTPPSPRLWRAGKSGMTEECELRIIPIPGPSALTAALSISGFPTDKFIFLGFPPQKKGREKFFKEIAEAKYTVAFYESVHRIIKTLEQLSVSLRGVPPSGTTKQSHHFAADHGIATLPSVARDDERQIVVCRELTKRFETVYRGTASEVLEAVKNDKIKGEFVVIIR